ncbi:hypothetical protein GCM10023093_24320 [Nemorincola caseinilytica]|uniref:Uncharacterized protein n=2 Tax=Nemorincola caseinilytica TaxID=2054315 RepID=A0ABP8NID4_9BACT
MAKPDLSLYTPNILGPHMWRRGIGTGDVVGIHRVGGGDSVIYIDAIAGLGDYMYYYTSSDSTLEYRSYPPENSSNILIYNFKKNYLEYNGMFSFTIYARL